MRCRARPKNLPGVLIEVLQAFLLYSSDHILEEIVLNTNAKAMRINQEKQSQTTWKLTDKTEILTYLGLVMAAGHLKQNYLCIEKCGLKSMDVPKNNKAVLILSSMYYDAEVTNDDIRKSEINLL